MHLHWNNLLNTDCVVVDVDTHSIYPIFRVGHTSLMYACQKKYVNSEIKKLDHIDIMIRDPEERFVSGVNKYCKDNKLNVESTWKKINNGTLQDRHFAPQYVWLLHLYKWYKGSITIWPFNKIKDITDVHHAKSKTKIDVPVVESLVAVDRHLIKYYNKTLDIGYLIKKYKHALS